jgi:small subunit ribosomal protein S15e
MLNFVLIVSEKKMGDDAAAAEMKRKRTFRKFTYRGVDLDQLLDLTHEQLMELFPCRIRRRMSKGLKVMIFTRFISLEFCNSKATVLSRFTYYYFFFI